MKRTLSLMLLLAACSLLHAGMTTYTFTSASWASKNGTVLTDRTTDGWLSDKDAESYSSSYQLGAKVTAGYSGAGAHTVRSFSNVRRLTLNYATTTRGAGRFHVEVGDWQLDTAVVVSTINRDLTITLPATKTGTIRVRVDCTTNSLFLYQVSVRSDDGAATPFTQATYRLVTDAAQLQDSDRIILGVPSANAIMGYFDESVSKNNIHAIAGSFTDEGTVVREDDRAVYTLYRAALGTTPCFLIVDCLRYEEAYLVASGGQTKNRLALWDDPQSSVYGDYGCWDISVAADGEAAIMSLGTSAGKYLQYNASNSPTLFGCYATQGSQTPVRIYRRVEALGNVAAIVAPLTNFGTQCLTAAEVCVSRTVMVNANLLTEDISVSVDNAAFVPSRTTLDRDGDQLTIMFRATTVGRYTATLTLRSGEVCTTVQLMAEVVAPMTVTEAVQSADYATVYLGDVEVTKKYDRYVFVRDATGSMLLYDNGDGQGGRYAQGVQSGDRLTGVVGRFRNYYGVPEINLTARFSKTTTGNPAVPESVTGTLDSADVCRLVAFDSVQLTADCQLHWQGEQLPVVNRFNVAPTPFRLQNLTAVVMLSWDELQLWLVGEEPVAQPQGIVPLNDVHTKKLLRRGTVVIEGNNAVWSMTGAGY